MKTSKQVIAEMQQRKAEYESFRQILLDIVNAPATANAEKISAIDLIYKLDSKKI